MATQLFFSSTILTSGERIVRWLLPTAYWRFYPFIPTYWESLHVRNVLFGLRIISYYSTNAAFSQTKPIPVIVLLFVELGMLLQTYLVLQIENIYAALIFIWGHAPFSFLSRLKVSSFVNVWVFFLALGILQPFRIHPDSRRQDVWLHVYQVFGFYLQFTLLHLGVGYDWRRGMGIWRRLIIGGYNTIVGR